MQELLLGRVIRGGGGTDGTSSSAQLEIGECPTLQFRVSAGTKGRTSRPVELERLAIRSFLREAENYTGTDAQIVLAVVKAVGELRAVIIRFEGADGKMPGQGDVQPAARDQGEGVG